jgi:hypothetical protein
LELCISKSEFFSQQAGDELAIVEWDGEKEEDFHGFKLNKLLLVVLSSVREWMADFRLMETALQV